jgi:hypothetical protein
MTEPTSEPLRITLDPPLEYDGVKYEELTFDFDGLTTADFQRAARAFVRRYHPGKKRMSRFIVGERYLSLIIAQVANDGKGTSGVPIGLIKGPLRRYYPRLETQLLEARREAIEAYLDGKEII